MGFLLKNSFSGSFFNFLFHAVFSTLFLPKSLTYLPIKARNVTFVEVGSILKPGKIKITIDYLDEKGKKATSQLIANWIKNSGI
jgi:hypothetical protein